MSFSIVIDLTTLHCGSMHDNIKQHIVTPIINVCGSATVALSGQVCFDPRRQADCRRQVPT